VPYFEAITSLQPMAYEPLLIREVLEHLERNGSIQSDLSNVRWRVFNGMLLLNPKDTTLCGVVCRADGERFLLVKDGKNDDSQLHRVATADVLDWEIAAQADRNLWLLLPLLSVPRGSTHQIEVSAGGKFHSNVAYGHSGRAVAVDMDFPAAADWVKKK
jgi:hypothetical protein